MTKEKVLRILDRHLNEPRDYHFVCYGGSSIPMLDIWSHENTYKCVYQGDKNWMTPICENCKGLKQKEKRLPYNETMQNYILKSFAETIIQELENE